MKYKTPGDLAEELNRRFIWGPIMLNALLEARKEVNKIAHEEEQNKK